MNTEKRTIVLLGILAIVMVTYFFSMPTPAPLTDTEIAMKIEWSGYGNTTTGKLPIVEIPKKDPFFRIVRVFESGVSTSGYHFKNEYLAMDFGHTRSMDVGAIIRKHKSEK